MSSSVLIKNALRTSIAESLFEDIASRSTRYYYFLGSTLSWVDEVTPPEPRDTVNYEKQTRRSIILVKEITPSDICYVIDRVDWTPGTVYDPYDDNYTSGVIGLDIASGGIDYVNPTITLTSTSGNGAIAVPTVTSNSITSVRMIDTGVSYNTAPTVNITDVSGSNAIITALLNKAQSGAVSLENSTFYVMTADFNVYKCIDNNNNSPSTVKPTQTSFETFTTSDGYRWRFMYNVPAGLRNKFLTSSHIPVTSSIQIPFYSNGEIKRLFIQNPGTGYTYGLIVVQGDGFLEKDPVYIIQADVNDGGQGYFANSNVTISPPIVGTSNWVASSSVYIGQLLSFNKNIYEVVASGTTGTSGPTQTYGLVTNGTAGLKFRGTTATANITVSGNTITGVSFLGSLKDITVNNGGSGYIKPPSVYITGGGGANATAYSTLTGNSVGRIYVNNIGDGYTSAPTVTVGDVWEANANVILNDQVFYSTRLYTVTTGGMFGNTAPVHTSGTATNGTANLTYAGTAATATSSLKFGAGYTTAPTISIADGSNANITIEVEKSEAIISPIITDGQVVDYVIVDGGIGYTYASISVLGNGSNANIIPVFSSGDLTTLNSTNELLAVDGAIDRIKVVSKGYGYTSANVSISGNGVGATATASIINGRIDSITLTSPGVGYTYADIVISGTGYGASARAVLPPAGGHGKNPVKELFSRSLMLYSTIENEPNQGFIVNNDYRQFGLIKDVRTYDNSKFFAGSLGSGCWVAAATSLNLNEFTPDVVVTKNIDGSKFTIVSTNSDSLLLLSNNDTVLVQGQTLQAPGGNTVSISGVTEPEIDKYSGSLLYIDNRQAFVTTEDQSVSLRTILKF